MADLFHQWGSDLMLGPTGDLAMVFSMSLGQQRVLRRLLTNPGDYVWHLDYGAGLGQFVGSPASPLYVRAVVRSQIFKESAIARSPEPIIEAEMRSSGGGAGVYLDLRYVDNASGQTQPVNLTVGGQ